MSGPEPGWLAAMRSTVDAATPGGWVTVYEGLLDPEDPQAYWSVVCHAAERQIATDPGQADGAHIAAWCPDNARRLLELADRMADALAAVAGDNCNHRPVGYTVLDGTLLCRACAACSRPWPCPPAQAAEALRAWRDATNTPKDPG